MRTQKAQKYLTLIFVFFVYVFWEFGAHFRKVVFPLEGRKCAHKKHKNQMLGIFVFFVYLISGPRLEFGISPEPSIGNFGE